MDLKLYGRLFSCIRSVSVCSLARAYYVSVATQPSPNERALLLRYPLIAQGVGILLEHLAM